MIDCWNYKYSSEVAWFKQWLYFVSQLAKCSEVSPPSHELWDFFSKKIVPVIRRWQVECQGSPLSSSMVMRSSTVMDDSSSAAPITTLFTEVVTHLEESTSIALSKVNKISS